MPHAGGAASVKIKSGYTEIHASFRQLLPARKFGAEFLTYVLWAMSTDGRARESGRNIDQRRRRRRTEGQEPDADVLADCDGGAVFWRTNSQRTRHPVNMPDILFESRKFALRPEAGEKLARTAGIVINYAKLRIEAEGQYGQCRVGGVQPEAFGAAGDAT
jgi:hypothetical protein